MADFAIVPRYVRANPDICTAVPLRPAPRVPAGPHSLAAGAAPTRRDLFGAIAGVPLAATLGTAAFASPSSRWDGLVSDWTNARSAEAAFDEKWFGGIRHLPVGRERNAALDLVPDAAMAESERLSDSRADIEDALIAVPAPNLSAVIFKIEMARKRWSDFEDWPESWWDDVMSDLRRLAGGR